MKELSIEQKAAAYDEAIKRARKLQENSNGMILKKWLWNIFPELKEGEDERIRKVIRGWIYTRPASFFDNGISKEEILAWLEKQGELVEYYEDRLDRCACDNFNEGYKSTLGKQGEQKSADKVEPKFHEGDWVVRGNTIAQILDVQEQYYVGLDINGEDFVSSRFLNDDRIHFWTIQDAKDGDVLTDGNLPFIFKKIDTNKYSYAYCGITVDDGFKIESEGKLGEWTWTQDIKPATKEQRDTLIKVMTDSGWEFDFEKKELKKIENEIEIPFGANDSELQEVTYYIPKGYHAEIDDDKVVIKKGEKPTSWGEENENHAKSVISTLEYCKTQFPAAVESYNSDIDWLKSLRERCFPYRRWSEEDEANLDYLIDFCNGYYNGNKPVLTEPTARSLSNWLCRFKSCEIMPSTNKIDNEEAEKTIHLACEFIRHRMVSNGNIGGVDYAELIKRLKSLRPQKQWKPSEEHIYWLKWAINRMPDTEKANEAEAVLEDLLEQLKKL